MADIKKYFPKLLLLEGGFVNDKDDKGGATKFGVTLAAWREIGYDKDGDGDIDAHDIRQLSTEDALMVLKVAYWDRWRADAIKDQKVAEFLVDWVWTSGKWGIVIPQRVLGVDDDGRVGMQTITAVNAADPADLLYKLIGYRQKFTNEIVMDNPSQQKFLKGWTNRINSFA